MVRATFVMEQHIGHRSFYQNLRGFIDEMPQIDASWIEVTYSQPSKIWERWPVLPRNIRGTLSGRNQVRQGLCRAPSDVLFFNTQVPAALAGRWLKKQPYILSTDITPRQYDQMGRHYGHQPDSMGLIGHYKHWSNTRLMQGAATILPWSTWVQDSLRNDYGVNAGQIQVLPPGVDTKLWQPDCPPADGPIRILFVGGDLERKGGELLLETFYNLPPGQAELLMVTHSALAPAENVTIFPDLTPNSPELVALYQSCHLFVLPTSAEAFGIAAVEASAVGLPVITTAVGGLTDVIAHDETGFLIQPGDGATLTTHLRRLVEDDALRQRLGRAGRKRVEKWFDACKNAGRLADILERTAGGRRSQ